jgi:hypothetical protein
MILFIILVAGLFISLLAQEFIPPLFWFYGARVLIMPIIMFYGALALPYWGMLALAFIAGFMWDAMTVQIVDSTVEISVGWSIVLYAALGAIMSGFRPLFQRGRWEVHCLVSGLFTSLIVLAEYIMITIRRGGLVFPNEVWWRVGGSGVVAALLAPIFFFALNWLATLAGYQLNSEKKGLR